MIGLGIRHDNLGAWRVQSKIAVSKARLLEIGIQTGTSLSSVPVPAPTHFHPGNRPIDQHRGFRDQSFYLPQLDGLRFFAFLLVFAHHHRFLDSDGSLGALRKEGWVGVDLFFALSAFLFAKLLSMERRSTGKIDARRFYMRRILRIWPAYFAYVGFCLLAHMAAQVQVGTPPVSRAIGLATFTDNIVAAWQGFNPILFTAHLWSICYEEQFYLAIPPAIWLLSKASPRTRGWVVAISILAGLCARALMIWRGSPHPAIWTLPWTHFESVALGAALGAGLLDGFWKRLPSWSPLVVALAATVVLVALPSVDRISMALFAKYAVAGILSVAWVQAAVSGKGLARILSHPALVHLGKRSYGLYLWHLAAIFAADATLRRIPGGAPYGMLSFVLSLATTCALAYVSYRWLESPFLRLKKKYESIHSRPI